MNSGRRWRLSRVAVVGLAGVVLLFVFGGLLLLKEPAEDPLPIWSIAFSPDGRRLVTGGGEAGRPPGGLPGELIFWNSDTGKRRVIREHGSVRRVIWARDGSWVAVGNLSGLTKLVQAGSGKPLLNFSPPNELLNGVAISPDGKLIAAAGLDGSIELWDGTGKELQTLRREKEQFVDVALSPNGQVMVTTSRSGKAFLFDLKGSLEPVALDACDGRMNAECVAFAPDGARFATGAGKSLRLWETASGKQLRDTPNGAALTCIAYAPDGQFIAGVDGDGRLTLWHPDTCEVIASTSAHPSAAFGLAISPDGSRIATAGREDFTLKTWKAPDLRLVNSFHRPRPKQK